MAAKIVSLAQNEHFTQSRAAAVQALAAGELVVLPTETVYGIAVRADHPAAVKRLLAAKNRPETHPFTLAAADTESVRKYIPEPGVLAQRLMRRCLPGPITLVCDASDACSAIHTLPPETKKYVAPENSVGLRVPAHAFTHEVLREADFPVVLTSANLSGQADTTSGEDVVQKLAGLVDMIVEDGECRYKKPSTVVRILPGTEKVSVLREGVCSRADIHQLCELDILFLCTGNTCRSPLGEVLAKRLLADRLNLATGRLREHGVHVHSAGTSVFESTRASIFGIRVAEQEYGMDLTGHRSRALTPGMLRWADFVYAMTETHAEYARRMGSEAAPRVRVLAGEWGGVSDPFGGTPEVYHATAAEIYRELLQEFIQPEFIRQWAVAQEQQPGT